MNIIQGKRTFVLTRGTTGGRGKLHGRYDIEHGLETSIDFHRVPSKEQILERTDVKKVCAPRLKVLHVFEVIA